MLTNPPLGGSLAQYIAYETDIMAIKQPLNQAE